MSKPLAAEPAWSLDSLLQSGAFDQVVIAMTRHGESESNTGEVNPAKVGDHNIKLTKRGKKQARKRGQEIGPELFQNALNYVSPFKRTRQTFKNLLKGAGLDPKLVESYEDPRLREIDTSYGDYEEQQAKRAKLGWFFYRYEGGESPADCFDRACTFLESMARQLLRKEKKVVHITSHGLFIRTLVMRIMHLTVEQFESMHNPFNCDTIIIAHKDAVKNPQFVSGKWAVTGLRLRDQPRTPEGEKAERKAQKAAGKAAAKAKSSKKRK